MGKKTWETYGSDDTIKHTMDSNPRITLAMSRESCAHSPSPSQTHTDPLGHNVEKFPSLNSPTEIRERAPSVTIAAERSTHKSVD